MRYGDTTEMPEAPPEIHPTSADGTCVFRDGRLHDGSTSFDPIELDFFERWTFARFLPGGQLALAFETGQPWSEHGSYGYRLGGVQVLARTGEPSRWSVVAIEYDHRYHDEAFVPDDIAWHPRGVLAWLRDGALWVQILAAPRGPVQPDVLPTRDSDLGLALELEAIGAWRRLWIDEHGRLLSAADADGVDVFDLERRLVARDGADWTPLADPP